MLIRRSQITALAVGVYVAVFTSCQSSRQSPSDPKGVVLAAELLTKAFMTNFRPTEIHCKWIKSSKAGPSAPSDLILHWQSDNTYTAYIRSTDRYNKNNLLYKTVRGIRAVNEPNSWNPNNWSISYELTYGLRFRFSYAPKLSGQNAERSNGVLYGPYWSDREEDGIDAENHDMNCEDFSNLATEPPMADEELVVVGPLYDKKLKEYQQISQSIRADLIHQAQNRSYILSLTNQLIFDNIPIHAPVFNKQGQIVGYVQKSNKNRLFAIEILSVHDPILGAALKKGARPSDWKPSSIQSRSPSWRYVDLVCRNVPNKI